MKDYFKIFHVPEFQECLVYVDLRFWGISKKGAI